MPVSIYSAHVQTWRGCTACSLSVQRSRVVLYRGQVPCDVLFVGEAPGESEDVVGTPFIGPAGKLLDAMIRGSFGRWTFCPVCRKAGRIEKQFDTDSGVVCDRGHGGVEGSPLRVGFTNLVGCIPKGDDGNKVHEPEDESIHACATRLQEIVGIAKPRLLVQVGRLAETWLTPGYKTTIHLPIPVRFAKITHPAAILRARVDQQAFARQQAVVTLRNAVNDLAGSEPPPSPRKTGNKVVSSPPVEDAGDPPF